MISRLKLIRDKQVAHLDLKGEEQVPLTFGEIASLIDCSGKILNLISNRYYGNEALFSAYKDQVILDSKGLLDMVDKHVQARKSST